jgi:membrane protein DedA with SNARE-associated domain
MSAYIAIFFGTLGSLAGALFNYYLSLKLGRALLLKYGKYIWFDEEKLNKLEIFFTKHGEISTFNGRLLPGIRQYISLPAGLAKMNLLKFQIYTSLGAFIWVSILVGLGYFLGDNEALIKEYLKQIILLLFFLILLFSAIYFFWKKRKA